MGIYMKIYMHLIIFSILKGTFNGFLWKKKKQAVLNLKIRDKVGILTVSDMLFDISLLKEIHSSIY